MSTMCYKCGQQTAKVPMTTYCNKASEELLTAVTNATYSTYVYTNDLLGRRTSKNDEHYGYNVRDELISADEVSYAYDDIGNRTSAEGKTYTANNLNQYIAIDDFAPQYDADGNQTLVKTATGIWSVTYNAENRPIRWQSGGTVITMAFDHMGRRVEMRTMKDGAETLQRFVYDNYLCIQQLRGTDNALFHSYVWDPTEPIATRPLVFIPSGGEVSYYFHDGNKNVSDLVPASGAPIHYSYTPFGVPTASAPSENPFRFSSEVYDKPLGLSYYNYRHYNSREGRWVQRDPGKEEVSVNLYRSINGLGIDLLGLRIIYVGGANERNSGQLKDFANTVGAEVEDTFDWSQQGAIEDQIRRILEENKCEPIVLIGHSWGGDTAAQVARNMSSTICNLTLITLDPVSGVKPWNLEHIQNPKRNNIWINVHPSAVVMDHVNSILGVGAWGIGGLISAGIGVGMNMLGTSGSGNNAIAIGGGRWNEERGAQNVNMGGLNHHDVGGMLNLSHPDMGITIKEIIKIRNN